MSDGECSLPFADDFGLGIESYGDFRFAGVFGGELGGVEQGFYVVIEVVACFALGYEAWRAALAGVAVVIGALSACQACVNICACCVNSCHATFPSTASDILLNNSAPPAHFPSHRRG